MEKNGDFLDANNFSQARRTYELLKPQANAPRIVLYYAEISQFYDIERIRFQPVLKIEGINNDPRAQGFAKEMRQFGQGNTYDAYFDVTVFVYDAKWVKLTQAGLMQFYKWSISIILFLKEWQMKLMNL